MSDNIREITESIKRADYKFPRDLPDGGGQEWWSVTCYTNANHIVCEQIKPENSCRDKNGKPIEREFTLAEILNERTMSRSA